MPLVIDTYNDYFFYLQYRRRAVPLTIKSVKLALQYFASVYGHTDTKKLLPTHMVRFHEHLLKRKREQKPKNGEAVELSRYSIYKTMVKIRAYIKRLESERYL